MGKCEFYEDGRAFDVESKNASRVYCRVERGKCPYDQEGNKIEHKGSVLIICNSNGLVGKVREEDKPKIERVLAALFFPKRQKLNNKS
jgi:hypothetical protein